MLLFGTPSKLLDGGINEEHFYSFLDIGYARRCIFGHGLQHQRAYETLSPEEIYHRLIEPTNSGSINKWASEFHKLADPAMYGWKMKVEDPTGIELLRYKIICEKAADAMKEHEDIRKAEMSHRYFKSLKLAGAFAFIDQSSEIELEAHLLPAIKLIESSGEAFQNILNRERSYVKLARYIADVGTPLTHADLHEALPFYGRGNAARNEMITLATAWGYKQHIIIKKTFMDNIEFFEGEKLQETNLNEVILSYSDNWAYHYQPEKIPFDKLHLLTQTSGMHWSNHHFKKEHRSEENVLAGFNLIVIDVDGGVSLAAAQEMMKEYKFLTYTTKSHTEEENRFRLIMPTNYCLSLDGDDYKEFMNGLMEWLPFGSDETANQRAKKWESFDGEFHYNLEGELLDVLDFIPKTSRNNNYLEQSKQLQSLDNLERWFAQRMNKGQRNNQMIKFALALVDSGMALPEVSRSVHAFNKKLQSPMTEDEIDSTILVTAAKRFKPS
jgi:hypothetical protein